MTKMLSMNPSLQTEKCMYCNKTLSEGMNTFCSDECADKAYYEYKQLDFYNMLEKEYNVNPVFKNAVNSILNER